MPLPIILGAGACIAAVTGIGSGVHGAVKMKNAKDTMKEATAKRDQAVSKFESTNKRTTNLMDSIGKMELSILSSFESFSDLIEKIQGRPEFKEYHSESVNIPKYKASELKEASVGAGLLLGGLGGAAAGTAGGFAAAGATTSAVMALGTASTGTAISSLSGAALTNATLAAIGGGATAAGGGGIALGTTILGATTAGVGLLIGGVIFNFVGKKLSNKADEAYDQAVKIESEVNRTCTYLNRLSTHAKRFKKSLSMVEDSYKEHLSTLENIIDTEGKVKWKDFTDEEKLLTENTVLLVGLLFKMCQVKLVLKGKNKKDINEINVKDIMDIEIEADKFMEEHINIA